MITVDITGELGDQLFQFALIRALAARGHRVGAGQKNTTQLCLEDFNIQVDSGSYEGRDVFEHSLGFHPEILGSPDPCTLRGGWQSEKYFPNHEALRDELTLKEMSDFTSETAYKIRSATSSVFIHVRRNDLFPLAYYRRAILYLRLSCNPKPKFFVFSDDPEWHRKQPLFSKMTIVSHNKMRECEELFLMSLCRHAIIADSTLSWWGAWLNRSRHQRFVISPDPWSLDPAVTNPDLIPEGWLRASRADYPTMAELLEITKQEQKEEEN